MAKGSLDQLATRLLKLTGFVDPELIREQHDTEGFENAEATFRVGSLLVRFQRERGQDFVDVGSIGFPEKLHQFDDVDIAMGWKSIEEVLAKSEPEALENILERLFVNFTQLERALSGEQERFTRARIENAAKKRGETFVKSLR